MNSIDFIIIAFLLISMFHGFKNGFINEIASLLGLIIGLYCAVFFSHFITGFLARFTSWSDNFNSFLGFVITFLVVISIISLASKTITKIADFAALGIFNKLFGAVLGVLKALFIASIFLIFIESLDREVVFFEQEKKEASWLYKPVFKVAPMILPKLVKKLTIYLSEEE